MSNSQNPVEFSKSYRILKILSNILYPIEYSYGSSEDSTIYLTFSIAYSIYSTSHHAQQYTLYRTDFFQHIIRPFFRVQVDYMPATLCSVYMPATLCSTKFVCLLL